VTDPGFAVTSNAERILTASLRISAFGGQSYNRAGMCRRYLLVPPRMLGCVLHVRVEHHEQ